MQVVVLFTVHKVNILGINIVISALLTLKVYLPPSEIALKRGGRAKSTIN